MSPESRLHYNNIPIRKNCPRTALILSCIVLCAAGGSGAGWSGMWAFTFPLRGLRFLPSLPVTHPVGSSCPGPSPTEPLYKPTVTQPIPSLHLTSPQSPGRHLSWSFVIISICRQAWLFLLIPWPLVSFPLVWAVSNHSTIFSSPRGQGFLLSCRPKLFVLIGLSRDQRFLDLWCRPGPAEHLQTHSRASSRHLKALAPECGWTEVWVHVLGCSKENGRLDQKSRIRFLTQMITPLSASYSRK